MRKKPSPSARIDFIHLSLTNRPCEVALRVNYWLVCSVNVPSKTEKRVRSSLLEFSRDNWQVQMREHVTAHPNDSGILSRASQYTAEVIYFDPNRVLTTYLVDKGHLSRTT
jgi:hypothetical protein